MKLTEIEIDLGSASMSCAGSEIGEVFAGLLGEMRRMAPRLREDEVNALREVMRHAARLSGGCIGAGEQEIAHVQADAQFAGGREFGAECSGHFSHGSHPSSVSCGTSD
jgi:hypothetical protein